MFTAVNVCKLGIVLYWKSSIRNLNQLWPTQLFQTFDLIGHDLRVVCVSVWRRSLFFRCVASLWRSSAAWSVFLGPPVVVWYVGSCGHDQRSEPTYEQWYDELMSPSHLIFVFAFLLTLIVHCRWHYLRIHCMAGFQNWKQLSIDFPVATSCRPISFNSLCVAIRVRTS